MVINCDPLQIFSGVNDNIVEIVLATIGLDNFPEQPGLIGQALEDDQVVLEGEIFLLGIERIVWLKQGDLPFHQLCGPKPIDIISWQVFSASNRHIIDKIVFDHMILCFEFIRLWLFPEFYILLIRREKPQRNTFDKAGYNLST